MHPGGLGPGPEAPVFSRGSGVAELAYAGAAGVGARAVEEAFQVAVGGPGAGGPAQHAEEDVEDGVGRGVAYGEASHGHDYLYALPACGPDEAYDRARDHGAPRRVEELVIAPAAVDDLRQDHHQREGREEMGDLVVERDRLKELPQEAGPVEGYADQDEGCDPAAWHPPVTSLLSLDLPSRLYPGGRPAEPRPRGSGGNGPHRSPGPRRGWSVQRQGQAYRLSGAGSARRRDRSGRRWPGASPPRRLRRGA